MQVFKTAQVVIMGLISATLWLRTQLHPRQLGDANRYASFLFFTLISLIFNGASHPLEAFNSMPAPWSQVLAWKLQKRTFLSH